MYDIYLDFSHGIDVSLPDSAKSYDVILSESPQQYDISIPGAPKQFNVSLPHASVTGGISVGTLKTRYRLRGNSSFAILSVLDAGTIKNTGADSKFLIQQAIENFASTMRLAFKSSVAVVSPEIQLTAMESVGKIGSITRLAASIDTFYGEMPLQASSDVVIGSSVDAMAISYMPTESAILMQQAINDIVAIVFEHIGFDTYIQSSINEVAKSVASPDASYLSLITPDVALNSVVYSEVSSAIFIQTNEPATHTLVHPIIFHEIGLRQMLLESKKAFLNTGSDIFISESINETKKTVASPRDVFIGLSLSSFALYSGAHASGNATFGISSAIQTLKRAILMLDSCMIGAHNINEIKVSAQSLENISLQIQFDDVPLNIGMRESMQAGFCISQESTETKLSYSDANNMICFRVDFNDAMRALFSGASEMGLSVGASVVEVSHMESDTAAQINSQCTFIAGYWQRLSDLDNLNLSEMDDICLSGLDYVIT